jgi:drug/metabolite transporter (DMT)-like permease
VATLFKLALRDLTPIQLLFVAVLTSLVVLTFGVIWTGGWSEVRRMTAGEWLRSAGHGLLNPFAYYLVLFGAYDRLPAHLAQPLNYTWPIVLGLLAIPFLGRRPGRRELWALACSFAGVVVLSWRGDATGGAVDPVGIALALGSALIWALSWLLALRDGRSGPVRLGLSFLFGAAFAFPLWLATAPAGIPPLPGLAAAAGVGCLEMGFSFLLWFAALRRSRSPARVAQLVYLVPFLSLIWIRLVLREAIPRRALVGLVLVVVGVIQQGPIGMEPDTTPPDSPRGEERQPEVRRIEGLVAKSEGALPRRHAEEP